MVLVSRPASTNLLNDIFRRYGGEVSRFVRLRLYEPEANDVMQATFLRATERIAQLRSPEHARAWLFRIARNVMSDAYRAKQASSWLEPTNILEDLASTEEAGEEEMCTCSAHLAQSLPTAQSQILSLVDMREATLMEAAAELGISVNAATVRLHRARKALRERLKEHCGVSSLQECKSCRCADDGCCVT